MFNIILYLVCVIWVVTDSIDIEGNGAGKINTEENTDDDCAVSINYAKGDLKEPQPLLLKFRDTSFDFLYPNDNLGMLRIPRNGDNYVYLACPGKNNYLQIKKRSKEATAFCLRDKYFEVNGDVCNFSSLICQQKVEHYAKYTDAQFCLGRNNSLEIGFDVSNTFVRIIELCRNDRTFVTYYTKFKMTKMIGSFQGSVHRPKFRAGDFFPGININNLYKFETQLKTIGKILKSPELAAKRLNKSEQFLSRGHMTAKTDFVYAALQKATFWYLNTAPQWKTFNNGNWNSLETSVRDFASTRRLDLDVYTGVHGQMTMEDINGEQQPIYLDAEAAKVPVPKFYWKVIYDPLSKRGTAFVGLNDPFIANITDDIYLCRDISDKITWLKWKARDIRAGISYACTVDDLRKAVSVVPELDVRDILTET